MEFLSILIIPILGAIIGYSTNLLAIAMLFRPHSPKYLFGLRIPFTPGLLVKERHALAQKIGDTLSEKVLTDEALRAAMADSEIIENIAKKVDTWLADLAASPGDIGQICADGLGRDRDELLRTAKNRASAAFEDFRSNNGEKIAGFASKTLEYLRGEDFHRVAIAHCNGVPMLAKTAIRANAHRLGPLVRKIFENPTADAALRELVAKIVRDNTSGLMGMFVRPDKIYASIQSGLLEYLDSADNQVQMAEKLCDAIDNNADKWLDIAVSALQSNLRDDTADAIMAFFNNQIDAHSHALLDSAVDVLFALAPAKILPYATYRAQTMQAVRKLVAYGAQKAAAHIMGAIDIAAIARDKINAFSAKEAESVILSVARKQLGYIAMLGGILGFIIGFLPAILM